MGAFDVVGGRLSLPLPTRRPARKDFHEIIATDIVATPVGPGLFSVVGIQANDPTCAICLVLRTEDPTHNLKVTLGVNKIITGREERVVGNRDALGNGSKRLLPQLLY